MIYKHLKQYEQHYNKVTVVLTDMCETSDFTVVFNTSVLTLSNISSWVNGTPIHIAMPNLTLREQSMFESGIQEADYHLYDRS